MTYQVIKEFPHEILFEDKGPFVSIYLPTHRNLPERRQDLPLFKQLLKEVEKSLGTQYPPTEANKIRGALDKLVEDKDFWAKTKEGLVLFATPETCVIYLLNNQVEPLGLAADSFHLKPLIKAYQHNMEYQILAISGKEFAVYQGDRYELNKLPLPEGVPGTIDEILGTEHTGKYTTAGAYGAGGGSFYHGQGSKKDDVKQDLENFYRQVDKIVYEEFSKASKLPLFLANLKERHSLYRGVAKNPYLADEAIDYSFDTHDLAALKEKADVFLMKLEAKAALEFKEQYDQAAAKGLASDDIEAIAKAVAERKVETIIIEENIMIPGKIIDESGNIRLAEADEVGFDDLIDDLGEMVVRQKGRLLVLSNEDMPVDTGIAAIYRY